MDDLLLSERPCVNYLAFMELVKIAVNNMWRDKVVFTAAFPTSDVDRTPIITYKIESKIPSILGKNQELKPRLRYSVTGKDGKIYSVYGQSFDFEIRFDIWGSTGDEADIITENFQQLILQYMGFFKKKGIVQLFLSRQENDKGSKAWRTDLMNRTLIYFLKLDEIKVTVNDPIQFIDLNTYVLPFLTSDIPILFENTAIRGSDT